jgi:hypothetical protein
MDGESITHQRALGRCCVLFLRNNELSKTVGARMNSVLNQVVVDLANAE